MTTIEAEIMRDAYRFLNTHDPPAHGDLDQFWRKAAEDMIEIGVKFRNHPLALEIIPAIYEYIEQKEATS